MRKHVYIRKPIDGLPVIGNSAFVLDVKAALEAYERRLLKGTVAAQTDIRRKEGHGSTLQAPSLKLLDKFAVVVSYRYTARLSAAVGQAGTHDV